MYKQTLKEFKESGLKLETYLAQRDLSVNKEDIVASSEKTKFEDFVIKAGESVVLLDTRHSWFLYKNFIFVIEGLNAEYITSTEDTDVFELSDCVMENAYMAINFGLSLVNIEQVAVAYYVFFATGELLECPDSDFSIFQAGLDKSDSILCTQEADDILYKLYDRLCEVDEFSRELYNVSDLFVSLKDKDMGYRSADIVKALYCYLKSLKEARDLSMKQTFAYFCQKYNGVILDSHHPLDENEQKVVNDLLKESLN